MTWEQIKELMQTGLFDIQSHTYWHPNFKQEKKRRSAAAYDKFVHDQLVDSKKTLEDKLGIKVTLLAWPFGIYNDYLEKQAAAADMTWRLPSITVQQTRALRPWPNRDL